jgi:pimeloyl-ACP methyl ester carboxylesterase
MARFGRKSLAAGAITVGAAGWVTIGRRNARRVEADPVFDIYADPPRGRPVRLQSRDGTQLHAEVFGSEHAPTIVLIHGFGAAKRLWIHQILALHGKYRVVAYDQRGHGLSGPPAGGDYSMARLGDDLPAVLDATVPEGRRVLVAGHSMGGMAIGAFADSFPAEVERRFTATVLVNTAFGDVLAEMMFLTVPHPFARARESAGRKLAGAAGLARKRSPLRATVTRVTGFGPRASPADVAFVQEMILTCPAKTRAGHAKELLQFDLFHALEHITVPTVVVASDADRVTPVAGAKRIADALPNVVDFVTIPDSGHNSPVEAPDDVTRPILELAERELTGVAAS